MKKLLALFVLLTALAVMATACSAPQDAISPNGGAYAVTFNT